MRSATVSASTLNLGRSGAVSFSPYSSSSDTIVVAPPFLSLPSFDVEAVSRCVESFIYRAGREPWPPQVALRTLWLCAVRSPAPLPSALSLAHTLSHTQHTYFVLAVFFCPPDLSFRRMSDGSLPSFLWQPIHCVLRTFSFYTLFLSTAFRSLVVRLTACIYYLHYPSSPPSLSSLPHLLLLSVSLFSPSFSVLSFSPHTSS